MTHLDLFSGIGGFAYAADQVFGDVEHIFCDNDKFCQKVLAKHWPESEIYSDIRTLITDADFGRRFHRQAEKQSAERPLKTQRQSQPSAGTPFLLTGGFPCQPFSQAGTRGGTDDDRYLWPEMLEVIRFTRPTWVIAENVSGLLTWDEGVVFEKVCADLEAGGYEVQPFIIPAAAVGAPHRRDRIWFVAHSNSPEHRGRQRPRGKTDSLSRVDRAPLLPRQPSGAVENDADTTGAGLEGRGKKRPRPAGQLSGEWGDERPDWSQDWLTLATKLCSVDDGLSHALDGFELSKSAHRVQQLKAYGNAIVPQVAMEIMRGMA